jgi:biotin carboxylase
VERCVRLLFLATDFAAQYRALRCVAALGAEVYVAGSGPARSLALSRYCRRFLPFAFEDAGAEAAAELETIAADVQADMLVPGDLPATQFLARVRPHLTTPVFPLSDPAAIAALGTKDRFAETCRQLGVRHPHVAVFRDGTELLTALRGGRISLPAMLKPINRAGGLGVTRIDASNAEREISKLAYAPVLMQDFVEGADHCISLFCRDGEVLKQVVYAHSHGAFRFFENAALARIAAHLVKELNLSGLINFDARIDSAGDIWMIECNPRFTFNMDVAMVAGVNFADWTSPSAPQALTDTEIRVPDALLRGLLGFRKPRTADWKMLVHWLKDPLVFALVAIGYQQRWRLPLFERVMTSGKCAA